MIGTFLPPYRFRGMPAMFLWVFYKMLFNFRQEPIFVIADESYRHPVDPSRGELLKTSQLSMNYEIPTAEQLAQNTYADLSSEVFRLILQRAGNNPNAAYNQFLTKEIPELLSEIRKAVSRNAANLECIVTPCNCPSLSSVCDEFNIPLVHTELGPLRTPLFRSTAYFDFSGVNGNTEASRRYESSRDQHLDVQPEELACFFALSRLAPYNPGGEELVGVALQTENDSNVIAFSNGYSSADLLDGCALQQQGNWSSELLVRNHPASSFVARTDKYRVDDSPTSIEFIRRCREVHTINSSVGVEALLLGNNTRVYGDAPYRFIVEADGALERDRRLAFFLVNCLVPSEHVLSPAYIRFRLGSPSESSIAKRHICLYMKEGESLDCEGVAERDVVKSEFAILRSNNIKLEKMLAAAESRIVEMSRINRDGDEHRGSLAAECRRLNDAVQTTQGELAEALHSMDGLRARMQNREGEIHDLNDKLERSERENRLLLSSKSWKLTKPLRVVMKGISSVAARLFGPR